MPDNISKGLYFYGPVVHGGYVRWLQSHRDAIFVALVGPESIAGHRALVKDVRALTPQESSLAYSAVIYKHCVPSEIDQVAEKAHINQLVMPDEPLMRELAKQLPDHIEAVFESVFLRWHEGNVKLAHPIKSVFESDLSADEHEIWTRIYDEADRSPDFWRQIGGAIVRDGEILLATHNRPLPDEYTMGYQGDPRALFKKGVEIELSNFLHAEAGLIAEAARQGTSLQGTWLYTTTFPCPTCAKLIASSGIEKVFFHEGYSMLDGETVLKAAGIQLIHVP